MNWTKVLIAGVVAGIVGTMADFVMHGMIMANTYAKYNPPFTAEQANPAWFFVNGVCIGIAAAILFAMTRDSWADGVKGGATYGFFIGLVAFFTPFYSPLVLEGFPYYLAWCQGGIAMIGGVVIGAVLGAMYKRA